MLKDEAMRHRLCLNEKDTTPSLSYSDDLNFVGVSLKAGYFKFGAKRRD
ncbi:hypothetical protein FDUTEX481_04429 [Tolypothrix sp. PCC 7601]|nr:hypothetical protein FDUTEX481_04429 [Tolypothrix sp. PCC 7601]